MLQTMSPNVSSEVVGLDPHLSGSPHVKQKHIAIIFDQEWRHLTMSAVLACMPQSSISLVHEGQAIGSICVDLDHKKLSFQLDSEGPWAIKNDLLDGDWSDWLLDFSGASALDLSANKHALKFQSLQCTADSLNLRGHWHLEQLDATISEQMYVCATDEKDTLTVKKGSICADELILDQPARLEQCQINTTVLENTKRLVMKNTNLECGTLEQKHAVGVLSGTTVKARRWIHTGKQLTLLKNSSVELQDLTHEARLVADKSTLKVCQNTILNHLDLRSSKDIDLGHLACTGRAKIDASSIKAINCYQDGQLILEDSSLKVEKKCQLTEWDAKNCASLELGDLTCSGPAVVESCQLKAKAIKHSSKLTLEQSSFVVTTKSQLSECEAKQCASLEFGHLTCRGITRIEESQVKAKTFNHTSKLTLNRSSLKVDQTSQLMTVSIDHCSEVDLGQTVLNKKVSIHHSHCKAKQASLSGATVDVQSSQVDMPVEGSGQWSAKDSHCLAGEGHLNFSNCHLALNNSTLEAASVSSHQDHTVLYQARVEAKSATMKLSRMQESTITTEKKCSLFLHGAIVCGSFIQSADLHLMVEGDQPSYFDQVDFEVGHFHLSAPEQDKGPVILRSCTLKGHQGQEKAKEVKIYQSLAACDLDLEADALLVGENAAVGIEKSKIRSRTIRNSGTWTSRDTTIEGQDWYHQGALWSGKNDTVTCGKLSCLSLDKTPNTMQWKNSQIKVDHLNAYGNLYLANTALTVGTKTMVGDGSLTLNQCKGSVDLAKVDAVGDVTIAHTTVAMQEANFLAKANMIDATIKANAFNHLGEAQAYLEDSRLSAKSTIIAEKSQCHIRGDETSIDSGIRVAGQLQSKGTLRLSGNVHTQTSASVKGDKIAMKGDQVTLNGTTKAHALKVNTKTYRQGGHVEVSMDAEQYKKDMERLAESKKKADSKRTWTQSVLGVEQEAENLEFASGSFEVNAETITLEKKASTKAQIVTHEATQSISDEGSTMKAASLKQYANVISRRGTHYDADAYESYALVHSDVLSHDHFTHSKKGAVVDVSVGSVNWSKLNLKRVCSKENAWSAATGAFAMLAPELMAVYSLVNGVRQIGKLGYKVATSDKPISDLRPKDYLPGLVAGLNAAKSVASSASVCKKAWNKAKTLRKEGASVSSILQEGVGHYQSRWMQQYEAATWKRAMITVAEESATIAAAALGTHTNHSLVSLGASFNMAPTTVNYNAFALNGGMTLGWGMTQNTEGCLYQYGHNIAAKLNLKAGTLYDAKHSVNAGLLGGQWRVTESYHQHGTNILNRGYADFADYDVDKNAHSLYANSLIKTHSYHSEGSVGLVDTTILAEESLVDDGYLWASGHVAYKGKKVVHNGTFTLHDGSERSSPSTAVTQAMGTSDCLSTPKAKSISVGGGASWLGSKKPSSLTMLGETTELNGSGALNGQSFHATGLSADDAIDLAFGDHALGEQYRSDRVGGTVSAATNEHVSLDHHSNHRDADIHLSAASMDANTVDGDGHDVTLQTTQGDMHLTGSHQGHNLTYVSAGKITEDNVTRTASGQRTMIAEDDIHQVGGREDIAEQAYTESKNGDIIEECGKDKKGRPISRVKNVGADVVDSDGKLVQAASTTIARNGDAIEKGVITDTQNGDGHILHQGRNTHKETIVKTEQHVKIKRGLWSNTRDERTERYVAEQAHKGKSISIATDGRNTGEGANFNGEMHAHATQGNSFRAKKVTCHDSSKRSTWVNSASHSHTYDTTIGGNIDASQMSLVTEKGSNTLGGNVKADVLIAKAPEGEKAVHFVDETLRDKTRESSRGLFWNKPTLPLENHDLKHKVNEVKDAETGIEGAFAVANLGLSAVNNANAAAKAVVNHSAENQTVNEYFADQVCPQFGARLEDSYEVKKSTHQAGSVKNIGVVKAVGGDVHFDGAHASIGCLDTKEAGNIIANGTKQAHSGYGETNSVSVHGRPLAEPSVTLSHSASANRGTHYENAQVSIGRINAKDGSTITVDSANVQSGQVDGQDLKLNLQSRQGEHQENSHHVSVSGSASGMLHGGVPTNISVGVSETQSQTTEHTASFKIVGVAGNDVESASASFTEVNNTGGDFFAVNDDKQATQVGTINNETLVDQTTTSGFSLSGNPNDLRQTDNPNGPAIATVGVGYSGQTKETKVKALNQLDGVDVKTMHGEYVTSKTKQRSETHVKGFKAKLDIPVSSVSEGLKETKENLKAAHARLFTPKPMHDRSTALEALSTDEQEAIDNALATIDLEGDEHLQYLNNELDAALCALETAQAQGADEETIKGLQHAVDASYSQINTYVAEKMMQQVEQSLDISSMNSEEKETFNQLMKQIHERLSQYAVGKGVSAMMGDIESIIGKLPQSQQEMMRIKVRLAWNIATKLAFKGEYDLNQEIIATIKSEAKRKLLIATIGRNALGRLNAALLFYDIGIMISDYAYEHYDPADFQESRQHFKQLHEEFTAKGFVSLDHDPVADAMAMNEIINGLGAANKIVRDSINATSKSVEDHIEQSRDARLQSPLCQKGLVAADKLRETDPVSASELDESIAAYCS